MRAALRLEFIGEDTAALERHVKRHYAAAHVPGPVVGMLSGAVRRPWVACITGRDPRYGLARQFVEGQIDYAQANSTGSRGVYLYFALSPGVYEVFERVSWKRSERYFLRVAEDGTKAHISREEVVRWLAASADSASAS